MAVSLLVRILGKGWDTLFPACVFIIASGDLLANTNCTSRPDQSTVVQRAETIVAECYLEKD